MAEGERGVSADLEAAAERLAEIRARAEAATPGPWDACGEAHEKWADGACACGAVYGDGMQTMVLKAYDMSDHRELMSEDLPDPASRAANAVFTAHAREDIPYLLELVAALAERAGREDTA